MQDFEETVTLTSKNLREVGAIERVSCKYNDLTLYTGPSGLSFFFSRPSGAPFGGPFELELSVKAPRGTVAIKGILDNLKGLGSCYGGHWFPLRGHPFPLRASFNCFIVGLGPGPLIVRFQGVSKDIGPQLA